MSPRGLPAASAPAASGARLDELLVARGLARTRAEAGRLILAGRVRLAGGETAKAGRRMRADAAVEVVAASPFVSRGGEKLAGALAAFGIRVTGRVCLDVGASTGGFTDCLLQAGARHVTAVDVGHGQLAPRLAGDPRVTVRDDRNARYLAPGDLPESPSLATIDVSFIGLAKILPSVAASLAPAGEIVALVKPQFEVGRGRVGKGGVVRDPRLHAEAVRAVVEAAAGSGLFVAGIVASSLRGPKGNREFFVHLWHLGRESCGLRVLSGPELDAAIAAAVSGGPRRGLEP